MLSKHPPTHRGFSLVELLVVMGIIVMLMAFLVPAASNFGRANALTTSGSMLTNLAALARQTAMSKNSLTALVLLAEQGSPEDFRAVTVMEYTAGTGWSQVGKWETFPDGIVVDRSNLEECTFLTHSPQRFPFLDGPPSQENPPLFYQGKQVRDPQGYAARIFLPTGGLQNPEKPAQIRLVEGYLEGTSVIYTRRDGAANTANFYDVAIVGTTGATKVSRP